MNSLSGDFIVLSNDGKSLFLQANNGIKLEINLEEASAYFSEAKISSVFLYPDIEINLNADNKPYIIKVKPSKSFYLFTIFETKQAHNKLYFIGKTNYHQSIKKIKSKNIIYQDSGNKIPQKVFEKLIGQSILVKKIDKSIKKVDISKRSINVLLNNEAIIKELPDDTYFSLDYLGKGKITSLTFAVFTITSELGNTYYILIAEFYKANKIDIKTDPNSFVGKLVKIQINTHFDRLLIKLPLVKPKKEIDLIEESFGPADFDSSKQKTLQYDDSKKNKRCALKSLINDKTPPGMLEYSISPQIFNKSLALVIGLALFEHLLRFKSDTHFKRFLENTLKKTDAIKIFEDWGSQINFKTFGELHSFLENGAIPNLKRIGEAYINSTTHDVETLEGIQDLCNLTGFCIHFQDFTEGFKELKLVPLDYNLHRRPIIRLGKYFNDYFLIYTPDQMKIDQYDPTSKNTKPNTGSDFDEKCFPSYDYKRSSLDLHLDEFLISIANKINENLESFTARIKGLNEKQVNNSFQTEIKNLRSRLFEEGFEISAKAIGEFNKIDFLNVYYILPAIKYTCGCCGENFVENKKPKYLGQKTCNHDFCNEHAKVSSNFFCFFCQAKEIYKKSLGNPY